MKKIVSLLLILCLALGISVSAFAVGAPKITKQPVSVTTDKQGNLTLSFRASDFVPNDSSWHFIEPETGNEWTGPQLRDEMKARKVKGFTLTASDGKQKLVLNKVPKFMHGWEVYALLVNGSFKVETDHIRVWYYGLDKTEDEDSLAKSSVVSSPEAAGGSETSEKTAPESGSAEPAGETAPAEEAEEEAPAAPKIITITANKVTLCPVDSRGNAILDQAAPSLTFEDSGSVAVISDEPVKYWTINGIRIEPSGVCPTSFVLKNITTDLVISAKIQQSAVNIPAEDVDPNTPCNVTCTGCSFTYHSGGLSSVTSGTVPAGATIIVFSTDPDAASKGFTINGTPDHKGTTSFRLKITGDTTITVP